MSIFVDFLDRVFGKKPDDKVEVIDLKDYIIQSETNRLSIDTYCLFCAVEMLANLMANCEIKTFKNGKEEKGLLWGKLNYQPNVNQSATEFWREFYRKLLYEGQVLSFETFTGDWLIADGFNKSDYEVKEKYFTDVYRGTFEARGTFPMSEVFYISYPNENAASLKAGLLSRYDSLIAAMAESIESGSGNKVLLNVNGAALGMPDFEEKYKDLMNNRFKSFFREKNVVLPLMNGMQATFANSSVSSKLSVDDITKLMNDGMTRAAQAYKISPALLTGEIAGIKEAINLTLTSAIDPLAAATSEQISIKTNGLSGIVKGNYAVVDTSNIKHIDIFDIASAVDKLIGSGFATPDEARVFAGLQPTGEKAMQQHYFTKNYSTIDEIMRTGGDNE